ncbi:hypothetical protein V502_00006 [Pseudogymnoascus sp. VKM F-4520 (FW-2644)]|nr:hypothetical protein V502_00006 [Pseudogymnoascus sp. VKM F-4520 (FW-2644)]
MASTIFPPRQCLTCESRGVPCAECLANCLGCGKPKINITVPWPKAAQTVEETQSPNPQNAAQQLLVAADFEFTEEYICAEHCNVIRGITQIFDLLRDMAYLDEDEIIRPPHINFPAAELTALGLETEVVALLRYLPYLKEDVEITAMSKSHSSLRAGRGAREVLWEGGNDLAPWVVRLTQVQPMAANHGRTIIYDLHAKTITQWANNENAYTNTYLDLPTLPAKQMLAQWEANLRALTELPWREPNREPSIKSVPPAPPHGFIDYVANPEQSIATSTTNQYSVDGLNHRKSMEKMFIDHGWPDEFRADGFAQARKEWALTERRLDYNRQRVGGLAAYLEYSEFLYQSASDDGIQGPGYQQKR